MVRFSPFGCDCAGDRGPFVFAFSPLQANNEKRILSMKKHLRSSLALFLSALLLAGALSPALAAPQEGERLDPLVRSVELFRGEEKLTDGAAVSTSDDLVVRYTLEPLTEEMALEGKTLVVSLPSCLQNANTTLNQPVLDIGHVRWNSADERVEFAFADDMGEFPILDTTFAFSSRLDLGATGGRQEIEIPLAGGKSVRLKVKENAVAAPAVKEKTGAYDPATGKITWTVELGREIPPFDEGSQQLQYTTGYQFEDLLGSKQTYVDGSLTFQVGSEPAEQPAVATSAAGDSFRCTLTTPLKEEGTIVYQTVPLAEMFVDGDQLADMSAGATLPNTARLFAPDGTTLLSEKEAAVKVKGKSWLVKEGIETDLLDQTVTWQITVHTNGCGFAEIALYDQLGEKMAYDPAVADLKVNGAAPPAEVTLNPAFSGAGGEADKLLLTINHPALSQYVITYKTKLGADLTAQNQALTLSNSAWLTCKWDVDGSGQLRELGVPTLTKPYKLNTSVVEKSGAYDPATRRITWKVTLNKNRLDIQNAVITDTFDNTNQRFVGNVAVLAPESGYRVEMAHVGTEGSKESYQVKVLRDGFAENCFGTDTVAFTYQTEATDPAFYAANAKQQFHNAAVFSADGIAPLTGRADPWFTSKVLEKKALSYDCETHQIRWQITVNQNKEELTGVAVEDPLPDYLRYVAGSFRVDGVEKIPEGNLRCALGDIGDAVVITFATELDVESDALPGGFDFLKDNTASDPEDKLQIENSATLVKNEGDPVTAGGSISIGNTAFDKSSTVREGDYTVNYAIRINQAGADLSRAYPDGCVLTDTLSEGLLFDPDSVRLYRAKVSANGSFAKAGEAIAGVGQQLEGNTVRLTLPLLDDPTSPYLLEYTAYVNVAGKGTFSLANSAAMGSTASSLGDEDQIAFHSAYSSGSATRIPGRSSLEVTVSLEGEGQPVEGAVYELYAYYPNSDQTYLAQTAVADEGGKLLFPALKNSGANTYLLKQKSAPEGIEMDPTAHRVTISAATGAVQQLELYNRRQTGTVSFPVRDGQGQPVRGAQFAIYSKDAVVGEDAPLLVADSDDGGQVCFEGLPADADYLVVMSGPLDGYGENSAVWQAHLSLRGEFDGLRERETGMPVTAVILEKLPAPPAPDPEPNPAPAPDPGPDPTPGPAPSPEPPAPDGEGPAPDPGEEGVQPPVEGDAPNTGERTPAWLLAALAAAALAGWGLCRTRKKVAK